MKRLLALLTTFGFSLALAVACTEQPVDNDGDDDDDSGQGGTGSVQCQPGTYPCGPQCLNLASDPLNCGACGSTCAVGQLCWGGACQCEQGLANCGTGCTNPATDANNCGGCGIVCPAAAPFCSLGACSASCGPGLMPCGQQCVALGSDRFNCGACGNACGVGQACTNGACGCPAGQAFCGTACVDVLSDPGNCGVCGLSCGGQTCVNGACSCPVGQAPCGTGCAPVGMCGAGGMGGTAGGGGSGGAGSGGVAGSATAGGGAGGNPNGGSGGGPTGDPPPGYWTHGSWRGCTWTGIDTVAGTTTTNMPRDFITHTGGGYCVSGSVHSDYESVALLGFNLNEAVTGSATQCAYNPANSTAMGPPGVSLSGTGIAVNFSKSTAATLRIQIQGPNAATDPAQRWCYTIVPAAGPVFAPFTGFNTQCWDNMGAPYNGEPISAIVFLVPGTMGAATPFNYCINGFAAGTQASDAPTWGMGGGGPVTGTIGGPGGMNLDFQRVKVAAGGKSYIIQNNNWGNPNGSDQLIRYTDNSFIIESSNGNSPGGGVPASFPSIYIGGNGDTQNGTYSTRSDDMLPRQISQISNVMTTFRHNATSGNLNAALDVWFAASPPSARYDDAISGFVMLWFYDPPGNQPIGSVQRSNVSIGGRSWNVWVGPRGGSGSNANAPVVSYVQTSTSSSWVNFDLKPFMVDAAQHGISQSWYLTDLFGGFECWSGGDCVGKSVQEFSAVVQ